jgi:hypothetical protein
MPDSRTALIGSHLLKCGDISPLLTRPGENIYLIKYNDVLDNSLKLDFNKNYFITPHGYGKKHKDCPLIRYDKDNNKLTVDSVEYNVKYGESLRDNPALGLRECTHQEYFSYLSKHYDYTVEQELIQLASYNKNGFIKWKV